MKRGYTIIVLTIITLISACLTAPKIEKIEQYRQEAINPLDKQMVEMDRLFDELSNFNSGSNNIENEDESKTRRKPMFFTLIEVCLFESSDFQEIFIAVLITGILCLLLMWLTTQEIIDQIGNVQNKSWLAIVSMILLISLVYGIYVWGLLIILILAAVAGITKSLIN